MVDYTDTHAASRMEMLVKILFGAMAGAVIGYIAAMLPLLTGGNLAEQRASIDAIASGVISGALLGCLLGVLFIYSSVRRYRYITNIEYVESVYKEIFYGSQSGVASSALRKAFSEEFLGVLVTCSSALSTEFKQGITPDKSRRTAASALARFFRVIYQRSNNINDVENKGYSDIKLSINDYISSTDMMHVISVSHGVLLRPDELRQFYAVNLPDTAM